VDTCQVEVMESCYAKKNGRYLSVQCGEMWTVFHCSSCLTKKRQDSIPNFIDDAFVEMRVVAVSDEARSPPLDRTELVTSW
jgi:hypothetical protein